MAGGLKRCFYDNHVIMIMWSMFDSRSCRSSCCILRYGTLRWCQRNNWKTQNKF